MRIFTPAWGDKNIDLLKNALGRSLKWPKNANTVKNAEWVLVTRNAIDADRIEALAKEIIPTSTIKTIVMPELMKPNVDSGMIIIGALRQATEMCLSDKKPMLMATPDFIYGDGTLETFKALALEPGSCVSIAHLRAVPHMLGDIPGSPAPTNWQLMGAAWRHAHISWQGAGKEPGNVYYGGVKWQSLEPGVKAVRHYMPSPFFYNLIPEDLEAFSQWHEGKPPGFGIIDHVWPIDLLRAGRLRFIGDSDTAMMVEITDPHMNVPPWNKPGDPPGFFRDHFHNRMQSQFVSIFKGEE